eukprot:242062_1
MSLNDPGQQAPELIESDDIVNNPNYPPWPIEVVSKWRIGSQLRHAMETESAYLGHKQGVIEFIRLLNTFELKDMEKVIVRDIDIILEIICTFDRADLLKRLIEHQYLSDFLKTEKDKIYSNSNKNQNLFDDDYSDQNNDEKANNSIKNIKQTNKKVFKPLQSTLKKAIRTGKIKVLNYLITQNIIPIKLFDNNNTQTKQYETDLKSLLYNILRAIEIGSKKVSQTKINCFLCAHQFWPYLAAKVNDLKESIFKNKNIIVSDNKTLKKLISSEKEEKDCELIMNLKAMNEDYLIVKYMSKFMETMFSNKQINNDQLIAIFDVLQFQRERYITFEDRKDIANAWKMLCRQLVKNYFDFMDKNNNNCLEFEIIDYLVSGGVELNDGEKDKLLRGNVDLLRVVQNGEYNWKMKTWNEERIRSIMSDVLPIDINKLIIHMLCL